MFRQGEVWVHKHTSDIALSILKVTFSSSEYVKIKAVLFDTHTGASYETAKYKILHRDFKHWVRQEGK